MEENTGYLPVEEKINAIQVLATDKLVMTESGFFEIFCNNDAQTPVYYDNMSVTMSSGSVMEVNAYYPFGKIITGLSDANTYAPNAYKFGAKEIQEMTDWGDHHNRMYDATKGGWWAPDPLAEKYYNISPYSYVKNNPVNAIDPDGRFPVFLIPPLIIAGKALLGGAIDAGAQIGVSMMNGQTFGEAAANIDMTSVAASSATSALFAPGMSTAAKVATGAIIAADAAIDIRANGDNRSIGGVIGENKPLVQVGVDAASSVAPGILANNATSGLSKSISGDLSANTAAILTNETKSGLRQVQSTVNSTGFQTGARETANFVGTMTGGQVNKILDNSSNSTGGVSGGSPTTKSLAPADNIRIQKPLDLELMRRR